MSNVADEGEQGINQYPNQNLGIDFYSDTNAGTVNNFASPIRLGGVILSGGAGVPALGGNVGDLYFRTGGGTDATTFYRCSVAGAAGVATWVAITGA